MCSEDDQAVLEDSSGRIRLKDASKEQNFMASVVTGSIIGLLGRADSNGIFHVEKYVYSGYA
jgi:hypothetical protein